MMLSPHTSNSANAQQTKYHNHENLHLKHQHQQANLNQIFLYSDNASGPPIHAKSLQAFGPKDTAVGAEPKTSFDPFGSLGFDSVLSMTQNQLNSARLPDNRTSFTPSSALDAADLQFSGYLLNGSGNTNNSIGGFSRNYYSCAPNSGYSSAQSDRSSGSSGGNSTHLLGSLGVANTNSFGSQQLGSGRYSSLTSPAIGGAMGTSGIANPSSEPSSYNASSQQSFSSTNNMPLLGYNSYASLLNKANLMFENNLDTMMIDWTLEERECCRRLVQFWRRHENNNIFCTFKAVAAADRVPNSIVVSCIYWEEKQDFFITSVDCIHLLESLIAVRFTVEEKNRIRRNLEGFRPLTVSKCKSESADFFKLIMSFPNPKPRNIEKDVKVFPWRILPLALKKIIGKYTASYSSTASIALDAYPSSRSTCYSRLTGMPISTSAGGMATFGALTSSPGSMLGASSASAAVVAAAAAAAEKSRLSASMPVTIRQSAANTSSLSAHANAGPDSGFEPLSMNDVSSTKIKGIHMTAHSAMASAASVPASDSSDQDYGSLLSSRDSKSKMTRPATTPYISNAGDGKDSYTEAIKNPGNADQLGIPSFMLSQGCTSQLDFAGMAANNPMPFLASDMPDQQVSAAQLYSSTNLLNQLAAGYGFSGSDYTLQLPESQDSRSTQSDTSVSSQPPPQQQQQQRVARSSSAKRNVMQHTPYSTERADRRKAENYRGSPSIPLILEQQQQHNVHHDANIFNSLVNIETSSAASSTTTFGEPSSADGASRHVGNNTSSKENGVHPPVYGALKKALLGPSGETADRKADPPPDDQQSAGGNDTAKGSCGSSVSMLEPGMFDTAAASASAEMFNFGLDGDFSFLANLIAASGGGGSSSSLATAPYDNGEIGLSPSSSNNTMAPEVPSEGDAQTTDVFSLVHLPGGQALGTIDGHGRSDQKNQQQQRQQWMEGGNNGRGDAEPRPIAASDIAQMGIQMAKSGILSGSAIEQMLSPATTPSQDGHQLHTSGSNLSVPAAASGSVALVGVHGPSQPQEPLFCADMFGGGKMQQPHMLDRRAHGL